MNGYSFAGGDGYIIMNNGGQLQVLFVDDEPMELEFYANVFGGDADVHAVTESSPDRALDLLGSTHVDCLVSDGVVTSGGAPLVEAAAAAHPDLFTVLYSGRSPTERELRAVDVALRKGKRRDREDGLSGLRDTLRDLAASSARSGSNLGRDPGPDSASGESLLGEDRSWRQLGTFEWSSADDVATSVVAALASELEREPTDFGPLFYVIDPDALGSLLLGERWGGRPADLTVEFEFEGIPLRLCSTGQVDYDVASV
jgi:hypothetical protein